MLYCLIVAVLFCIGNLLNSRQRKSFFGVVKEGRSRTIKVSSGYSSIKAYQCFFGLGAPASVKCFDLNSMIWLGLFTNKTFRKHLKLIFRPHRDFIIRIFLSAIRHPPPSGPHFTETLPRALIWERIEFKPAWPTFPRSFQALSTDTDRRNTPRSV